MIVNRVSLSAFDGNEPSDLLDHVMAQLPFNKKLASSQILYHPPIFYERLSFFQKIELKIASFFYKFLKIKNASTSVEWITTLAFLLQSPLFQTLFIGNTKRKSNFLKTVSHLCKKNHLKVSIPHANDSQEELCKKLTYFPEKNTSLYFDNLSLHLELLKLSYLRKNEILYELFNELERKDIFSCLEYEKANKVENIYFSTSYERLIINSIRNSGEIDFVYQERKATPPIVTNANIEDPYKGATNQRKVMNLNKRLLISGYCGALTTKEDLLAQLLLLIDSNPTDSSYQLTEQTKLNTSTPILFISFYPWTKYESLIAQSDAAESLTPLYLQIKKPETSSNYHYHLLLFNIPLDAPGHLPTPAETKQRMTEFNKESLIFLTCWTLKKLDLPLASFPRLKAAEEFLIKKIRVTDFAQKETLKQKAFELFDLESEKLIQILKGPSLCEIALKALLLKGKERHKGINCYLYLRLLCSQLSIVSNANCENSLDGSLAADAADKAQYVFHVMTHKPYLPGISSKEEVFLFNGLKRLYRIAEEPAITEAIKWVS